MINFFLIFFLSIIDSLNVFSYNKVITLIQSRNFVYLIFNFELYSFVINAAMDVRRAVELVNTMPIVGLIIDIVEVDRLEKNCSIYLFKIKTKIVFILFH